VATVEASCESIVASVAAHGVSVGASERGVATVEAIANATLGGGGSIVRASSMDDAGA
jgi:hypothetical protein